MKTRISLLWFAGIVFLAACSSNRAISPATLLPETPMLAPMASATPARIDLDKELYLRQVRKDVFVVTHSFPWPANSLIVEMSNSDLVLVGTPYTPDAMNQVLAWITAHFGKRKIVAIDPGYHADNLGGNSALIRQGILVYGSDLTARLLVERGERTRKFLLGMLSGDANDAYYKALAAIPFVAPTKLFPIEQGLTLSFGDEQVQVYYPGPSQAPDKLAVYFPSKKLLFGSCMILGGDQVGNTSDADLKNWPDAVRKLKQFDVEIVVPGHGDRLDPGLIDHTIDLLTRKQ